jgi:hypothetical protein
MPKIIVAAPYANDYWDCALCQTLCLSINENLAIFTTLVVQSATSESLTT